MANPNGNPENLKPVRTKEEAKKRGAAGGKKSGAARRKKRDARQAISLLLDMAAKDNLDKNLKALGYTEEDRTNMNALMARMFTQAMGGDVNAFKALMDYGGFHPDQNAKDAESKARIRQMDHTLDSGDLDAPDSDEEETLHIYLPDNGRDDV